MTNKIIFLLFCCCFTLSSYAYNGRGSQSCAKFYMGLSTGINNQSGLIGINFDVPVTGRFSLGTGLGLSSWGFKTYGEGRFYFSECNRGWALGTGVTYNTGFRDFALDLPTTTGTDNVLMDLNPLVNVMFSGYHFFNLGHGGSRFYLQLGWSQCITGDPYVIKSAHVLTSEGKSVMNVFTPGGVIVGLGFSFGLGR